MSSFHIGFSDDDLVVEELDQIVFSPILVFRADIMVRISWFSSMLLKRALPFSIKYPHTAMA